jgi:hypothetical protein
MRFICTECINGMRSENFEYSYKCFKNCLFNKIIIIVLEFMITQCANGSLHALLKGNPAGK